MAGSTNEQLAAEAQGSLALLDAVQEDKLFANLLPHSKGVVLLWGTKIGQCHACRTLVGLRTPRPAPRRRAAAPPRRRLLPSAAAAGLGVGGRWGQGIVISRLPPLGPDQPERWSAPRWVKVRVAELGLCFGCANGPLQSCQSRVKVHLCGCCSERMRLPRCVQVRHQPQLAADDERLRAQGAGTAGQVRRRAAGRRPRRPQPVPAHPAPRSSPPGRGSSSSHTLNYRRLLSK